jgi:acyl-CoA reductase-like NAD-dependent aldehyde dehydrogenase
MDLPLPLNIGKMYSLGLIFSIHTSPGLYFNFCSGPAVLMGNTIIVKPSPFTPYSALKLSELAAKCFPPGVVQALSGDDDLGPWMTAIDGIDKI